MTLQNIKKRKKNLNVMNADVITIQMIEMILIVLIVRIWMLTIHLIDDEEITYIIKRPT